nr:MAG TPA_asm: head to tail adaptor [Caudoviricetes sp.]
MDIVKSIKTELEIKNIQCSDEVINLYVEKARAYIKRYCNIEDIPDELEYLIVEMVVKLIENKYESTEGNKEIKSKTMGDTSITYNTVSRKEYTYEEILNQFSSELNNYRCLKW